MKACRIVLMFLGFMLIGVACDAQLPQCTQCVQCDAYPPGRKHCDSVETYPSGLANCQSVGDCNGCNGYRHCVKDPLRPTLRLVAVEVNGQQYARVGHTFRPVQVIAARKED